MPIITVKVEEELKAQVTAVVEELGLDIPTAIRMYLKAIVRENGLPITTKLTFIPTPVADVSEQKTTVPADEPVLTKTTVEDEVVAPVAEQTSAVEEEQASRTMTVQEAEPIESAVEPNKLAEAMEPIIDYSTRSGRKDIAYLFIGEICSIPSGSLTRWKDMETKLSARYGTEVTRPQNVRWPATITMPDGTEIKIPYWRIVSERGAVRGDKMIEQSVQEEMLKVEGHTFIASGHGIFSGIKVDGWKEKLV